MPQQPVDIRHTDEHDETCWISCVQEKGGLSSWKVAEPNEGCWTLKWASNPVLWLASARAFLLMKLLQVDHQQRTSLPQLARSCKNPDYGNDSERLKVFQYEWLNYPNIGLLTSDQQSQRCCQVQKRCNWPWTTQISSKKLRPVMRMVRPFPKYIARCCPQIYTHRKT